MVKSLRAHLLQVMDADAVPLEQCLRKILLQSFNMCYARADNSRFKYQDPHFNLKRLWVSRLLAHFYCNETEEVLLVSIDECSFRSDKLIHAAWGQQLELGKRKQGIKEGQDVVQKRQLIREY